MHASHLFGSTKKEQFLRRFSPTEFSTQLIREWTNLVGSVNRLDAIKILPHLSVIQEDFSLLNSDISMISKTVTTRTYQYDELVASTNYILHALRSLYERIFDQFNDEFNNGLKKDIIETIQNELIRLQRTFFTNFLGLLPAAYTTTPEMTRKKVEIKAAMGEVVGLLDASLLFRKRIQTMLSVMSELHGALDHLFTDLNLDYKMEVCPTGYTPSLVPTQSQSNQKDGDEYVERFVADVADMLKMELHGSMEDKIRSIESVLSTRLMKAKQTKKKPLRKVSPPPPKARGIPKSYVAEDRTFTNLPKKKPKKKQTKKKTTKKPKTSVKLEDTHPEQKNNESIHKIDQAKADLAHKESVV